MPSLAPIAVLDGAATPVSHTYTPTKIDASGVATLQERVGLVPVGYPTMTWSVRPPVANGTTYKVVGKLVIPKVITTTDTTGKTVTSVDYSNQVTLEFVFANRSTTQERKDMRVLSSNVLKDTAVIAILEQLESFY